MFTNTDRAAYDLRNDTRQAWKDLEHAQKRVMSLSNETVLNDRFWNDYTRAIDVRNERAVLVANLAGLTIAQVFNTIFNG